MAYLQRIKKLNNGQSIIELVLVMGLLAVLIPVFLTGTITSMEGKPQEKNRLQALEHAKNQLELFKILKSQNWNLVSAGEYYIQDTSGVYSLVAGYENVDANFSRHLLIEDIYRNVDGDIVEAGTNDPSTFKVTSIVEWTYPIPSSVEIESLVARIDNNYSYGQTDEADFSGGTTDSTEVTNTAGGEISLIHQASSEPTSWDTPIIVDSHDDTGGANALCAEISGNYLYVGSTSLGSDEDIYVFDISDPNNILRVWSGDLGGTINNMAISGNYLFAASGKNFEELMVFDISDPTNVVKLSALSVGDQRDSFAVAVSGNYAYVGKDAGPGKNRELFVVNVTNKSSPSVVTEIEISNLVNDIVIVGTVLYLASVDDTGELRAYSLSNPTNPSLLSKLDIPSGSNAQRLFNANGRLYLTTDINSSGSEFYIININNPSSMSIVGSYDVGDNAYGVSVLGDLAFVATGVTDKEFLILDISSESSIVEHSSLDLGDDTRDIQLSGGYAFLATDNDAQEVVVVGPSTGGSGTGYYLSGTFESSTKDFGGVVGLNYFDFDINEPSGTSLNFQVAVNNDNNTWNYMGPDGTSSTYFETPYSFPLIYAEGRYLRVKAYFSSDSVSTPVLSNFNVNYSE